MSDDYDPDLDGIQVGRIVHEWQVLAKLGEGSFGEVWKVQSKDGKSRAMKKTSYEEGCKEKWALDALVHSKYIPTIWAHFRMDEYIVLVMTLGAGDFKSLREAIPNEISRGETKTFSKTTSIVMCHHLLSAVDYCHNQNILHRDIKESNVCMKHLASKHPLPILLIDFGTAVEIEEREPVDVDKKLGTSTYCSPLMATGACATRSCDLRMLLYTVMMGRGYNVIQDTPNKSSLVMRKELELRPEDFISPADEWLLEVVKYAFATPTNAIPDYKRMIKMLENAEPGFVPSTARIGLQKANDKLFVY